MTPGNFIAGRWQPGQGDPFTSIDPATGLAAWEGRSASDREVDDAVQAAAQALASWAGLSLEQRTGFLKAFAQQLDSRRASLVETISRETGKPHWESHSEVQAMAAKIDLSIQAHRDRRPARQVEKEGVTAAVRYKPHGVTAVFGPFNLPGHLPHGHIVPALLAGNTVVFKPSERTPAVGQLYAQAWEAAGLPAGVFNLVQGARPTGEALANHPRLDGLFFTGGTRAGLALLGALAGQPQKILALEMGGNNPLVVDEVEDLDAAAYLTVQSAYITAGQRCTCARRLIVPQGRAGDAFLQHLLAMTARLRIGPCTDRPEPFMGPVISDQVAQDLLASQQKLLSQGGRALLELKPLGPRPALLSPGLIDVTAVREREDVELFGPLLQLVRVKDFDEAIAEANRTCFGLVAGLLSDSRAKYERYYAAVRTGLVNWNRQTTGASGSLPFGGVGLSGNHRPAGYWSVDYCSYPVATLESPRPTLPSPLPMGFEGSDG